MNRIIDEIMQEHEEIERELVELETIINEDKINYSNLIHILRKLTKLWDKHEKKEDIIFDFFMQRKKLKVYTEDMLFEHDELRPHRERIVKAIKSGSEIETKNALKEDGSMIIKKLREHLDNEENELYSLASRLKFSQQEFLELNRKLVNEIEPRIER